MKNIICFGKNGQFTFRKFAAETYKNNPEILCIHYQSSRKSKYPIASFCGKPAHLAMSIGKILNAIDQNHITDVQLNYTIALKDFRNYEYTLQYTHRMDSTAWLHYRLGEEESSTMSIKLNSRYESIEHIGCKADIIDFFKFMLSTVIQYAPICKTAEESEAITPLVDILGNSWIETVYLAA